MYPLWWIYLCFYAGLHLFRLTCGFSYGTFRSCCVSGGCCASRAPRGHPDVGARERSSSTELQPQSRRPQVRRDGNADASNGSRTPEPVKREPPACGGSARRVCPAVGLRFRPSKVPIPVSPLEHRPLPDHPPPSFPLPKPPGLLRSKDHLTEPWTVDPGLLGPLLPLLPPFRKATRILSQRAPFREP